MQKEYKICSRCIMDTSSDPNLVLDEKGVCNYCHEFDDAFKSMYGREKKELEKALEKVITQVKEHGRGKKYDCILGLSGGVDSSYMAYLAHQYGLRVLAVHVDAGWNSEIAVQNIMKICDKLQYDLHTVVVDWDTMKEVQRAFMFSGMVNMDVPQDHVFVAAVYDMAKKYNIKYILNGRNLATEGILSSAWQCTTTDFRLIKDVCRKHGRKKINFRKFPHYGFWDKHFYYPRILKLETVYLLDYDTSYSKKNAMEVLKREFDWNYYGGKHYESRLTKFLQENYLPQRYGWDKRRDHLSSLIVGGELDRDAALMEIENPIAAKEDIQSDEEYVLKKLDISQEEYEKIKGAPWQTERNYKNQDRYEEFLIAVKKLIKYKSK
ncbi:MAG: N-acetyl sugar amidotransferase [Candidatus Gastranaerophilales bacterium]|nr:N-acetyl sugar amidotransferase [Candidatus Gastranaerophilales bacterium]